MTERVTFPSTTGDTASGELALPAGDARGPAVVVIQEWWGVNDQIKRVAENWAAEGAVALAVDLYRGKVIEIGQGGAAGEAMNSLDRVRAMADLGGAIEYARAHARTNGRVVVTGYCMGGAFSFAAAYTFRDLSAVIPFYGLPPPGGDWNKVEAPIQAHFASKDGWAKPDGAREIQATLKKLGKTMELHVYEADHAFCNERRPDVYNAGACAEAWSRATAFVKQHAG
jgi:carboxymethylenebutenolidase